MELLAEVAGAQVAADAVDVYPAPVERTRIRLRASRVNAVLGTDLDAEDVWGLARAARHRARHRL